MVIPDVNLLIYAYTAGSPQHSRARAWWEALLNSTEPVGMAWVVILGFIRLMTHSSVLEHPLSVDDACGIVGAWLSQPNVQVLEPGPGHFQILHDQLSHVGIGGKLVNDAHLAALAAEFAAVVHSNDADLERFRGIVTHDPLNPAT